MKSDNTKKTAKPNLPDNSRVKTTKINDHIYLMDDNHEGTGYLVIGDKKALVIDTMNGCADVKAIVRKYTDLPLIVVNTHGHPDHMHGNIYFDEVYLCPDDADVYMEFTDDPEIRKIKEETGLKMPDVKDIKDGDKIDLGSLHLDVIALPGHTPGSILLLLKEDRILFTGDAVNHHLWMQLHHSTSLKMCRDSMERVLYLEKEADRILHGHTIVPDGCKDIDSIFDDISLIRHDMEAIDEILSGNTKGDEDYKWFGGVGKTHPIPNDTGVICFNPISDRVKKDRKEWAISDAKRDKGLEEPQDVKKYRNISYGLFKEHNLLDVYVPTALEKTESDKPKVKSGKANKLPVLINVHGGGYFYGDKELYRFYAMDMARYGFIVVNFNYRLSPEYKFPSALQDINNVVIWIEEHAKEYGMDTERVFMMGDSAGAQLTSHYAAINSNEEFASYYPLRQTKIKLKGISLACGMYDIPGLITGETLNDCAMDYIGEYKDPKNPMLDVLGAITKDYPATYIFSSPNDFLYENCEPMYRLIIERGAKAKMKIYGTKRMKNIAHVFHCNMYTKIGAKARKDQADFLLSL